MTAAPQPVNPIAAVTHLLEASAKPADSHQDVSPENIAAFENLLYGSAQKTKSVQAAHHATQVKSITHPVDVVQAATQYLRASQPEDPTQLENLLFAPPQKTAEIKALEFFQKQSAQRSNPLDAIRSILDDPEKAVGNPAVMEQLQSHLEQTELNVEMVSKLTGMLSQDINKLSSIQ